MPTVSFQWPPDLAGMTVTETVYCRTVSDTRKALVYRPAGKGPFPALVCVHGGAWVSGDRFATSGFAELVAATGIVVMAIDTRLAPRYPYPAAVEDVHCAVRWLKAHAAQYDIDAGNVGALGISSGGYLALLASLCPGRTPFGGETPAGLQQVPDAAHDGIMVRHPVDRGVAHDGVEFLIHLQGLRVRQKGLNAELARGGDHLRAGVRTNDGTAHIGKLFRQDAGAAAKIQNPLPRLWLKEFYHRFPEFWDEVRALPVFLWVPDLICHR